MAYPGQIRGMLLEELLLYLLRRSGYRPVEDSGEDPTVTGAFPNLKVKGRGEVHQIDAVADFPHGLPFLSPQRLLIEAKAYSSQSVGIDRVRNGIGVLTDVSQFFFGKDQPKWEAWRYHYQYILFSTSGFSERAQRFAFAHDIPLIPLAGSSYFSDITDALFEAVLQLPTEADGQVVIDSSALRRRFRRALSGEDERIEHLENLMEVAQQFDGVVLGMISTRFPVLLVPMPQLTINELPRELTVEISWDQGGWYMRHHRDGERLFSFDLPNVLFREFANEEGVITRRAAVRMKERFFGRIDGFVSTENTTRIITFRLDEGWLDELRAGL